MPIRSSAMVGKKTECPKCKYKFVVPEPPEEDGAAADAPKKGKAKKSAKKGGSKTLVYVGAGVGLLAVILLVVAGVFLVGGDDKPATNAGGSKPVASAGGAGATAAPGTTPSAAAAAEAGPGAKVEDPTAAATAPATTPPAVAANSKLKDFTNLLPNETSAVYRVNFDRLNSHATPIANAFFDTKVKDLFRNSMTFGTDNLAAYIHCVVGPDRDTFGVMRTKTPIDETAFYNNLKDGKLPNGVKRNGREMFLLKSNAFVDAVSQAFTTRTLTKMVGIDLPPQTQAEKDAVAKKQYAVCVYDSQTVLLGDLMTMERYLEDLSDSGFPPFKSELTTEQPPAAAPTDAPKGPGGEDGPGGGVKAPSPAAVPNSARTEVLLAPSPQPPPGAPMPPGGAGASGGPGRPRGIPSGPPGATPGGAAPAAPARRLYTTVPTYRTIDPPLKKMLNLLEADETDPPAVVYAEKLDQRIFNGRQYQQLYQQTGNAAAALLARVQMVGAVVTQLTQDKGNVAVSLEFVSDDDAKKTVAEAILPGLKVVTPFVDFTLGTRTQVKDNSGAGQGGSSPGDPGLSEGGDAGAPGSRGPPQSSAPPGRGRGAPGGDDEGRGGFPGQPGAGPDGGLPTAANAGLIEIDLADRLLTVTATMKWPEEKYKAVLAPLITRLSSMMKGRMSVLTGEIEWHRLASVSGKLQDSKKSYPRGTLDRESSDTRYRLAYPPEQRCSFFVDLLPYIGQGPLRNQIQDKKFPWFAKENINAGEAWVPEFLVPYYPQETWRATHPLAEGKALGATNYVAPAGLGLDAGYYDPNDPERAKKVGITGYTWGSKPNEVKDGLSNTFYLLQAAPGTARPWVAGGGATNVGIDEANPMAPFVHKLPDGKRGTYALMADGSVRFLKEGTDPKLFNALVTRAGGESLSEFDANAPKVAATKPLDGELRGGAVAGKGLPAKEAEVNIEDLKQFQGTWKATFIKSKELKKVPAEALDQIKVEVTFDGKLIRQKITGLPGGQELTPPPEEIVKIDLKAKSFDMRDAKGKVDFNVYEFRGAEKLFIRASDKARPAKATVPDDKSDDFYVELERSR